MGRSITQRQRGTVGGSKPENWHDRMCIYFSTHSTHRQENKLKAIGLSLDKAVKAERAIPLKNNILKTIQLFNNNHLLITYYMSDAVGY